MHLSRLDWQIRNARQRITVTARRLDQIDRDERTQ